ncbi:MAG: hypothetical protein JWM76_4817 [Pseudonocardiales bacterium]|nr:hypothetical protein [Pseudonocardiales bacterium]
MTGRSARFGDDLAADLLFDLADEDKVAHLAKAEKARARTVKAEPEHSGSPFLETTVFLAPSSWLRPTLRFTTGALTLTAGPIRLRMGR